MKEAHKISIFEGAVIEKMQNNGMTGEEARKEVRREVYERYNK